MYYVLKDVLTTNQIAMLGVLAAFILTFLMLKFPFPFLPKDQGRAQWIKQKSSYPSHEKARQETYR